MRELNQIVGAAPGIVRLVLILLLVFIVAKFAYRHVRDWKGGTSAQELMYLAVAFAALTYVKVI
jgi:hypothetical protein